MIEAIEKNYIKGWKKHFKMTLNLFVIEGCVKFVFYDEYVNKFFTKTLTKSFNYSLTVPPGIWFGFKGLKYKKNIIMNFANLPHDDNEVISKKISQIKYNW